MFYLNERLKSTFAQNSVVKDDSPYEAKWNTIAHRVLIEDSRVEEIPNFVVIRLDFIITEVRKNIIIGDIQTISEAKIVLKTIEKIITSCNFICSIPAFLVHNFSTAIKQKKLIPELINSPENKNRVSHIEAHKDELFSFVDCDLSSLLYLAIADVLKLPLKMVEVPGHSFIRWRFSGGEYLNWDTNYGFNKFTNEEYIAEYNVNEDLIDKGVFLVDLTKENTEGYFCFIRAISFMRLKRYVEATEEYRNAIKKYPKHSASYNNIAWLFVSKKESRTAISVEDALNFSLEACKINRTNGHLDTLACVYAELGQFEKAIEIEEEAYLIKNKPEYLTMIEAFKLGKTWLEINS